MEEALHRSEVEGSASSLTATADIFTFTPGEPVDIVGWGIIVTTASQVGTGMTVKGDKRPTAGSDTSRGDGDVGSLVVAAGEDKAAGKGWYKRLTKPVELNPGQELVIEVTNAADTAGAGYAFVRYTPRPMSGSRLNLTEV